MSYGRGTYGKALYGIWSYQDSGAATTALTYGSADSTMTLVSRADPIEALTTIASIGTRLTTGQAALTGAATLTADSVVENINGAHFSVSAALSAVSERLQPYAAALDSVSSASAAPSVLVFGALQPIEAASVMAPNATRVTSAACALTALSTILANGRGIYDPIPADSGVWQVDTPAENLWTPISENSTSWTETPVNG
ncbi:hypothetical protein [Sinorhizobium phage phiM5]|nr:hypothetical protein [Sinorhizobium phage phiM5]